MTDKRRNSRSVETGLASATLAAHDARVVAVDGFVLDHLAKQRTAHATAKRQEGRAMHVARAGQLHDEGLSAPQIAVKMAKEEGKPEPYPERTIRRWLSGVAVKKG